MTNLATATDAHLLKPFVEVIDAEILMDGPKEIIERDKTGSHCCPRLHLDRRNEVSSRRKPLPAESDFG